MSHVHRMRLQISSRLVELVIKIQVEMMRLQIRDEEHGGHRTGKLAKGVVYVLGLVCNALPEPFTVDLGRRTYFTTVLPWTGSIGMKRPSGAELALAKCINGGSHM